MASLEASLEASLALERQVLRDVEEVVVGCRWMILAAPRSLIYSMDLEVRHLEYMPGCWCRETMANGRAWKRCATPESVVLIYEQNIIAQLANLQVKHE